MEIFYKPSCIFVNGIVTHTHYRIIIIARAADIYYIPHGAVFAFECARATSKRLKMHYFKPLQIQKPVYVI